MRSRSPRTVLIALALAIPAAVSYLPALAGGFVWDDRGFAEEPVIHAATGLRSIWFSPAELEREGHYWPLVYSSFWLEHKLWGLAPAGYHAVNVALHLVNCLLTWRLLVRLRVPGAVVIAAVFAVHPVHVESVAWIIERKDVLSALFYLSAVLVWIRFVEQPQPGRYALALGLFTAGLLSKSVVVTLPVALLIWHWWRYGKVTPIDLLRLAPFAVVAVAITVPDLAFYASREQPLELGYSLVERALIASRALWFYAGTLVWPAELAVIYPHWEVDAGDPRGWAYLAAAAGLAAGLWLGRRRIGRGPLAGALFFAVTLAPVLGFVDYGYLQYSFVADRYQYLAGIGVLAVLIGGAAHGVGRLPDRFRAVRIGACALTAVVVAALGALTWRQAGVYRDEITLFSHVVAHNPAARDAHLNLGNALNMAGRYEEALEVSRIAVEQRPDSAAAHSNLGAVQMNLEQFDAARGSLRRALELQPGDPANLQNVAEALRSQGRHEQALAAYRDVLAIDPQFALAYAGMGHALYHLERHEEALRTWATAFSLQPDLPRAAPLHRLMGRVAEELGRPDAADHYARALELDPHDAEAIDRLARARFREQRHEEAYRLFRTLAELDPDDARTHANLGTTLYYLGRGEDALRSFERALSLDPDLETARAGVRALSHGGEAAETGAQP